MQAAEGLRQSFREALKSGELRITRDDHIDPISGSLFAIVEEDFLEWLNRQVATRRPRRNLRASQIASAQGRLRLNCGAQRGRLTIYLIYRSVVTWPNG